jgi:hypothetical protein
LVLAAVDIGPGWTVFDRNTTGDIFSSTMFDWEGTTTVTAAVRLYVDDEFALQAAAAGRSQSTSPSIYLSVQPPTLPAVS